MQRIILATYGYYPYFWGGSEVYVHGLAKFLQRQGHEVVVIAGVHETHLGGCDLFYEDKYLKAGSYEYEGVPVIGCANEVTTNEIYSRYNPAWEASWLKLLEAYWGDDRKPAPLLHFHAFSPLINTSLATAARTFFPGVKTLCSYHVPESCPKGTLVRYNRASCEIKPGLSDCTACVLHDRLGIPPALAALLEKITPNLPLTEKTPALLRAKWLTGQAIEGFSRFAGQMDQWQVFSHQIEGVLLRLGVPKGKVTVLRHGIDDRFFEKNGQETPSPRPENLTEFLFAGRFKKVKGIGTLLKAWLQLQESPARKLVLMGGEKTPPPELAPIVAKAQHRKDIEWAGLLPVEKLRARLRSAHCMIVPSEWVEIGPLVIHEAIACGANVITVDVGGCAELAAFYGENCATYRMGDENELAQKIKDFKYRPVEKKVTSMEEHYTLLLETYQKTDSRRWLTAGC